MIGLGTVKSEMDRLIARAINDRQREEKGLPVQTKTMHLVFAGPPGTGKTTVANDIGGLYKALGLLPKGQVHEAKATDLIGGVLGETQAKTQKAFDKARGGVLFIDEAYTLVAGDQDLYGKQAVDILVEEMEKHRSDTVVIMAGYGPEMTKLIKSNPGLASRMSTTLHFQPYTTSELGQIWSKFGAEGKYTLAPGTRSKITAALATIPEGNAREARNLYEAITAENAVRNATAEGQGVKPATKDLRRLTPEDVEAGVARYQANRLEAPKPKAKQRKVLVKT